MTYHILNGDALAYSFPEAKINGELIICREALISGDISGDSLREFWQSRAAYHGVAIEDYDHKVVAEFDKLLNAPPGSTFNLWFEYDLFCQINMWFVISLINSRPCEDKVYAVYASYLAPDKSNFWTAYGPATAADLNQCFNDRILLTNADLQLAQNLWQAYKNKDLATLDQLSENHSPAFPYLKEVIKANNERYPQNGEKGRPEKIIEAIIQNKSADFNMVMQEFWRTASIYGFGNLQLKQLYDQIIQDRRENK